MIVWPKRHRDHSARWDMVRGSGELRRLAAFLSDGAANDSVVWFEAVSLSNFREGLLQRFADALVATFQFACIDARSDGVAERQQNQPQGQDQESDHVKSGEYRRFFKGP